MTLSGNPHLKKMSREALFGKIAGICNAVAVSLKARDLLEVSLKKTMELFGAKRGSIFILDENSKELILKIAQGMEAAEQDKMVKRLGQGVVGKVAQTKQPLIVEDISKDSRFKGYKPRTKYGTPSFICAPLMIKDKLIGVINIADKESGRLFSKEELQLLDFISSQIALNYRRTQLYQKFKSIVKESKSLKDELGKTSQVTDKLKKQVVLQEKLASIGKLTAGIAHELNNPLDGVLRYVNLSLDQTKEEDDLTRNYLLEAKQGLHRMANVVKSLLATSRNAPPTLEKINVNQEVKEAISALRNDLYHKDINVEKYLAGDIPEIMDYGIQRIVSNLVRNAIDAVGYGGKIKVRTALANGSLLIQVSDDGCGISKEEAEEIFEPFYTSKDIDKGCGLGLTIVSEIVKTCSGKINIESEPEKGTTFSITFPLS